MKVSVDIFLKFEKRYQIKVDKKLIAKCKNTFEFCNGDLNKFVLLLYKVLILMNVLRDGEKVQKNYLLNTDSFYNILVVKIMKSFTSVTKKIRNTLNIKNIRVYQDLCVQSYFSLLLNTFENLPTICLKPSERDRCCCYTVPKLKWITASKI